LHLLFQVLGVNVLLSFKYLSLAPEVDKPFHVYLQSLQDSTPFLYATTTFSSHIGIVFFSPSPSPVLAIGDLKADLESTKRAQEALESEVARLRDDLKHANEKQKELERCITKGQDNAAAMAFRNKPLTRQLEEGQ
jgi:hypothetical protein